MRNVWKGMVVGAFTGAAAGLALDLGERGAGQIVALGGVMTEHAPEVADHVRGVMTGAASAAADRARSANLPSRITSSAAPTKITTKVSKGVQRAGDAAADVMQDTVGVLARSREQLADR